MNKEQNDITIIAFFGSSIETSVIEHAYILKSRTSCWRVSLAPTTSTSVKYTYDYVVLVFALSIHDNEYTEKSFACQDFQSYVSNWFIYFLQTTLHKCLPLNSTRLLRVVSNWTSKFQNLWMLSDTCFKILYLQLHASSELNFSESRWVIIKHAASISTNPWTDLNQFQSKRAKFTVHWFVNYIF